jgi:hypothetical protein
MNKKAYISSYSDFAKGILAGIVIGVVLVFGYLTFF